jgi:hypothetical protein
LLIELVLSTFHEQLKLLGFLLLCLGDLFYGGLSLSDMLTQLLKAFQETGGFLLDLLYMSLVDHI